MNPIDFAWAAVQSVAHKTPKEIKVITDKIEYPVLERDSVGYVIHLSEPRRIRDNLFNLHGLFFDNDREGKGSLWRMFRASVYHLCLHAAITDYTIYRSFVSSHEENNALFAISMAEDFAIRGYSSVMWPGLLLDEAYANYLTSLRLHDLANEKEISTLVAANFLSYQMTGKPVRKVHVSDLDKDIESAHATLVKYSSEISKLYHEGDTKQQVDAERASNLKVAAAETVATVFEGRNLHLSNIHSLPYTESHGSNCLFDNSVIEPSHDKRVTTYHDALDELSISLSDQKIHENEASLENEGNGILTDWEYTLAGRQRLVDSLKDLDPETHFEEFTFPSEDYAQFVRTRSKLIGPIRRVLDQLRTIKSTTDEVYMKESGYIDIPMAIQVIASKSDRNDVFLQDEIEKKSESWAILIDSSKSLETLKGQVRDIAVCLSEVARDLIPDQHSWSVYSFDEKMYIIKDFAEIYGNTSKARIGGLQNGIKTYLPDAIRAVSLRLARNSENLKVLIVASDGLPLGYDGIDRDLIKAIEKANRSGIDLIGVGVGSSKIAKYFRSNCMVDAPFDLMNHFVRTYYELAAR